MTIHHTNYYFEDGPYIDLMPFMEPFDLKKDFKEMSTKKPLIEESIIESGKGQFRAERYIWLGKHCYVFIDITMGTSKRLTPSPKKPSYVAQALKEKKIKIIKTPYHAIS